MIRKLRELHRKLPVNKLPHRLLRGATLKQTTMRVVARGGTELHRAATYGECWDHLRRMVEDHAIPYDTCMAALRAEYHIDPAPMNWETSAQGGWRP